MGNGVHESVSTQVRVPSDGDRREPQRPGLCQSPPLRAAPEVRTIWTPRSSTGSWCWSVRVVPMKLSGKVVRLGSKMSWEFTQDLSSGSYPSQYMRYRRILPRRRGSRISRT